MKSIAIITARGGSKRIPRKNIKEFLGTPILAYSIKAALEAGCFDEVMVSTDDQEIADIAINYGAKVPFFRSESTSGDFATTADVLREVLTEYKNRGLDFDMACVMYPTAPFITAEKLSKAIDILKREDIDSVLSMVKYSFPPQRAFVADDNFIRFAQPEFARTRSQDLQPYYHDCGQFCCFKTDMFLEKNTLVTDRTYGLVMPETEVQDIDTFEDWEIAEIKYSIMKKKMEAK
ncbi:MAG: pseudaminic acid cytidylyltransferase [Lachnospiraceae bacterium]|nr:pseudaminic acid cytidylyltransferase [Lachnospiraceae bacterium]